MQKDMHYYGTFVLARAAGINESTAHVIATASQFVDDSVENNTDCVLKDGSKIRQIVTAHHTDSIANINRDDQRKVWVPFHFLPGGGEGKPFYEKLICVMDSRPVRDMVEHTISCHEKSFFPELIGIAAHVYADTFSHYGFSGISSHVNRVDNNSFKYKAKNIPFLQDKLSRFWRKFAKSIIMDGLLPVVSATGEVLSGALGHGAVATFPDLPYLEWSFKYETGAVSKRNNRETFLAGCKALYSMFRRCAEMSPPIRDTGFDKNSSFESISHDITTILAIEGEEDARSKGWENFYINNKNINTGAQKEIPPYLGSRWEKDVSSLCHHSPVRLTDYNVYKFYQAAEFHQTYILRVLLPSHGIYVV